MPTLFITTWRGEPGIGDKPRHEQMGRITHRLLETLKIPWLPFPDEAAQVADVLARANASMRAGQRPFVLVMSKDTVTPHRLRGKPALARAAGTLVEAGESDERLTRTQALELILSELAR